MESHFLGFNWPLLVRTILKPLNILILVNVALFVAFFAASGVDIIYNSDPDYCEWRISMETHFPHNPILMLIGLQCITGAAFFLVMIVMALQEIREGFSKEQHCRMLEMMDREQELAEKASSAAAMDHYRAVTLLENQIELEQLLRMPLAHPSPARLLPPGTESHIPAKEEVQ